MAFQNTQTNRNSDTVENVATFRRRQVSGEICCIPELSQNRKTTDVSFLIAFGICIVILMSLMIYALCNSNMERFTRGYDNCGNVCGSKNTYIDGIPCSGQDKSDKPFLSETGSMQCVKDCGAYEVEKFNRCVNPNANLDFFPDVMYRIQEEAGSIAILSVIGLAISIVALLLFKHFVREFVWSMLVASILLMLGLTGFMWYLYSSEEDGSTFLGSAVLLTIMTIVFALFILILILRIKLVIQFFKEAVRIIFAMPIILLEPVLTIVTNLIVLSLFVYTYLLMSTSGTLQKNYDYQRNYEYVPNGAMLFVIYWNIIMMLWMVQFTLACQQMVIAGAVATKYFTREQFKVVSPIYSSFYNLIRFHLGTVAFGSFTIMVVTSIKILINALSNERSCLRLFRICLQPLEDLLRYMTSMGYIETAIHGQPLCRSSIRAINLVISNYLSAIVMNNIGSFVFFMAKLLVVAIVVLIGVAMDVSTVTIIFGGVVAFFCIHCIFVVFEIAVDTIFICFCEDQCLNDGNTNPYYTNVELYKQIKIAQFYTIQIENAKKK